MMHKFQAVKGKDIVRVLTKAGWVVLYVRGSHHQLEHSVTRQRITVAVHVGKDMRPWLVLKILKAVKMSEEEFRNLL